MGGVERVGDLDGGVERDRRFQSRRSQPPAQRLAFNEFSRDITPPVRFADFVNGDDVRMVESRNCFGLLNEAAHTGLVAGKVVEQQFERDLALEAGIARQINLACSSSAQKSQNSVIAQPSAG